MAERIVKPWRWTDPGEDGQDLLEYALLTGLIALVAFGAVANVGTILRTVFWDAIAAVL